MLYGETDLVGGHGGEARNTGEVDGPVPFQPPGQTEQAFRQMSLVWS